MRSVRDAPIQSRLGDLWPTFRECLTPELLSKRADARAVRPDTANPQGRTWHPRRRKLSGKNHSKSLKITHLSDVLGSAARYAARW
jgi:hypothetical protein